MLARRVGGLTSEDGIQGQEIHAYRPSDHGSREAKQLDDDSSKFD